MIRIIEFICAVFYAVYLLITRKRGPRVVLYYHSVKEQDVAGFRKQMEYLARNCTVVKPSNIKTADANGANRLVAITFDDAFVNVMENAVPILKRYALSAAVFVPVGSIGQQPCWEIPEDYPDRDEAVMTKEQIAELDNDGFEILSHTLSHTPLTEIENGKLKTELITSKLVLEEIVGHEVCGLSYPHGAHNARVSEAARQAGYRCGFTIEPHSVQKTTDDMQIGRFAVSPTDGLMKFRLNVNGAYHVVKYLQRAKSLVAKESAAGV